MPPAIRATGDACGAGDRLATSAGALLAGGSSVLEALAVGVEHACAFVASGGVTALFAGAPRGAGSPPADGSAPDPAPDPALDPAKGAFALAERIRASGGRLVATGGCFDLLHAGHIATLETARSLGDALVVCLNSDASVRRLKGPGRPLVGERDRARVLGALACVDAVVVFDEDTPAQVLERLRPAVFAKGGDYAGDTLPEAAVVEAHGGRVVLLPYLEGRSTTRLVEEITGAPARRIVLDRREADLDRAGAPSRQR
jgi:rfaE bifunctional protein nucleotidyltransferase chain/domain